MERSLPWFILTCWVERVASIHCKRAHSDVCLTTLSGHVSDVISWDIRMERNGHSLSLDHTAFVFPPSCFCSRPLISLPSPTPFVPTTHPLPPHCLHLSNFIFVLILDMRRPEKSFLFRALSVHIHLINAAHARKEREGPNQRKTPAHLLF